MTARETLPILGFLIGAVLVSLFVTSNVVLNFLVFTLILAIAAQGWNLLGGYGGQYSFGHAAFFGMGAYVSAILQQRFGVNAYPAVAFGIAAAALLGYAIGAMVFRAGLRGSYFALVTLAFAEVLRILANATEITGGAAGLLISLNLGAGNLQFADRSSFLILGAVLLAFGMLITLALEKSRLGAQLVAVRENEAAAAALGSITTVEIVARKKRRPIPWTSRSIACTIRSPRTAASPPRNVGTSSKRARPTTRARRIASRMRPPWRAGRRSTAAPTGNRAGRSREASIEAPPPPAAPPR